MGLLSRLGGEIPQVGIVDENTTALTYKAICQGRCSDKEFKCSDIATRGHRLYLKHSRSPSGARRIGSKVALPIRNHVAAGKRLFELHLTHRRP